MIPIYVNHHPPLIERKQYLESRLNTAPDVTWVTEPTGDQITEQMEAEWYSASPDEWNRKCLWYDPPFRRLRKSDISCSLGHILAWQDFINSGYYVGLFLEDDAIMVNSNDFYQQLTNCCDDLPQDLDVLFIGGGFNHTIAPTKKVAGNFVLKNHPSTNTVCSYLLTQNAAIKMANHIHPFTLPIDFEANYWFAELKFNVYHYLPYLIKEGTASGAYSSVQIR
jgi:GR25 family glycosyltransferase involved in LPS biosynthesis